MGNDTTTTTVLARGAAEGPATWAFGSLFEQLASGAETGGAFGLTRVTQPAGTATPVHVHTREAEAFYLLEGMMTYRAGEQTYQLSPGSFIYLPTGVPHAFRVTGAAPVSDGDLGSGEPVTVHHAGDGWIDFSGCGHRHRLHVLTAGDRVWVQGPDGDLAFT